MAIYNIPLLYAPEVDLKFKLDEVALDKIEDASVFNTLKIEFFYVVSDGYNSYYKDSYELLLDHARIRLIKRFEKCIRLLSYGFFLYIYKLPSI